MSAVPSADSPRGQRQRRHALLTGVGDPGRAARADRRDTPSAASRSPARGCTPAAVLPRPRRRQPSAATAASTAARHRCRSGAGRSVMRADCVSRSRWASSRHGRPSRISSDSKIAIAADGGQIVGVQQRGCRVVQFAVERDHDPGWLAMGQKRSAGDGPSMKCSVRRVDVCQQCPPPRPVPTPASSGTTATRSASSGPRPTEAVVVDRSHRAVITLTGADRKTWLHTSPPSTSATCPTARSPRI